MPSGQATVADMLWQLERQCRLQETFLLLRCYGPTWTEGDACMSSCGPDQTDISLDALGITKDTYLTFYYIRPNQPEYYSQPPEQAPIHSANATSFFPQAGGNESMPSASPYYHHQPRNSMQHPEQNSISPAVAPSFDHQDGGNEGMQSVSPCYRSTEDFSTTHAQGQPSYDIGDFIRAHDLTGAVSMTILVPTRVLPQRVLRNADTLGTSIFEQFKRTYNDTMGLLTYARGTLLPTMVLLEFGFGGPVSLVGFAIVALGLQLHGADPRMQQLVVRLPSTERYSDKLTQEGQGFPTQVRFVNKSYFLHTVQFEMEFNPLMQWAKSERIEMEMIENTHPIGRISTTADVERYLQLLFKRKLYGASTAAESVGQFERPLVAEAYDITDNGRAKSTSPGDEIHLGYAAMNQVERLEERLRGASIREDTFVKCTVLTDESVHLATKLCSNLLPRKLWAPHSWVQSYPSPATLLSA